MSDTETLAETPVETPVVETPVTDGIIDLDALEEVKPETDEEAKPEAKAEEAKPEGEEEKKKLSGAQRGKLREQRLLNELSARDREIEELRRSQPAAKTAGDDGDKP